MNNKEIIDIYTEQYIISKKELRGYFIEKEAILLINLTNYMLVPSNMNSKNTILASLDSCIDSDGVDINILKHKVLNLTEFQCHTILGMSSEYWNCNDATEISITWLFGINEKEVE